MSRATVAVIAVSSCVVGCGSFHSSLREFDSVAGWKEGEPAEVRYKPPPADPPRELIGDLIDYTRGSNVQQIGATSRRLLWVLEKDQNTLNRMLAIRGLASILATLKLDPMDPSVQPQQKTAGKPTMSGPEIEAAMRKLWPSTRKTTKIGPADRELFQRAVNSVLDVRVESPAQRRFLIQRFAEGIAAETDRKLRGMMRRAFFRAVHLAGSQALRETLSSGSPKFPTSAPQVRIEALRALRRLCGLRGVAYALAWMQRYRYLTSGNPYDESPQVRLRLVRFCGQLKAEHAVKPAYGDGSENVSEQGGRRAQVPIDFLYDTAIEDTEEHLRQAALEALGRCLARRRIDLDPAWAKEWRQRFILERKR